ncbi:Retrovirus-related Pol polyprotein from transposon TNT 1-94 [Senna tora]|uniref:Retrovirus-related Pol polyprotein from transposon TNT 1-94 n=1 Tax=Senna tora TaxID=362788 RepID=A0A834WLJ7_9FABA|nr:Retrovirus-related Pol polyprotein from transposon TNT 1-94 [Senna tora]
MVGVSLKNEAEALYTNKRRGSFKQQNSHSRDESKSNLNNKRFGGKCYNCGKKGHMAKDCWSKKKRVEGNAATSKESENSEEDWDAEALLAMEEELALTATTSEFIDHEKDWIVDSGCANHMTCDKQKLQNVSQYKGNRVVVTADNSKLPIAHIGKTMISPQHDVDHMTLQNVYHVPSMKKNLLSISQLTSSGHFVLFGPDDVKVYRDLKNLEEPVMKGRKSESVYVMSAESAYVDKTRRNETTDLWHMRLSHVSYSKLSVMMKKSMLKGLPQLEIIYVVRWTARLLDVFLWAMTIREKGGNAVILQMEGAIHQGMLFDEASSWWSSEKEMLPEQKNEVQVVHLQSNEDSNDEHEVTQSPWQTGVYQQQNEAGETSEVVEPAPQFQLRRSARVRKPNPKYANATTVEEEAATEPEFFEEASHIGLMSRYMQSPKKHHLEAVRRILRYVKSTIDYGLLYKKGGDCKLVGYCDADYVGDHDTRRSTTGYVFKLGDGAISWCSKRQPTVSLSTTEAEYRAATVAAQESTWLVQLMKDLHQPLDYASQAENFCHQIGLIRRIEADVEREC